MSPCYYHLVIWGIVPPKTVRKVCFIMSQRPIQQYTGQVVIPFALHAYLEDNEPTHRAIAKVFKRFGYRVQNVRLRPDSVDPPFTSLHITLATRGLSLVKLGQARSTIEQELLKVTQKYSRHRFAAPQPRSYLFAEGKATIACLITSVLTSLAVGWLRDGGAWQAIQCLLWLLVAACIVATIGRHIEANEKWATVRRLYALFQVIILMVAICFHYNHGVGATSFNLIATAITFGYAYYQ